MSRLETYVQTHKKLPRSKQNQKKDVPVEELQLSKWWGHQRDNYNKQTEGMTDGSKRRKLFQSFLDLHPELTKSKEDEWNESFQKLETFWATHNRLPRNQNQTKDVPAEELQLQNWWKHQRTNFNKKTEGMTDGSDRRNLFQGFLDKHPELTKTKDDLWMESLQQVHAFFNETGKLPIDSTNKVLSRWMKEQKSNYLKRATGMEEGSPRRLILEAFLTKPNAPVTVLGKRTREEEEKESE